MPSFLGVGCPITSYSLRRSSCMSGSAVAPHLSGRVANGLDDLHVTGAAAQMPYHGFANFVFGWIRIVFQQRLGGDNEPWGAKPALDCPLLHERCLNRIQGAVLDEPL